MTSDALTPVAIELFSLWKGTRMLGASGTR
jgi:hypothetical protein